jgi:hypothetical protein
MMQNFNIGALDDWQEVGIGEIFEFELPDSGARSADFQVLCDGPVSVMAMSYDGQRAWLCAHGTGWLNVKFNAYERFAVTFQAHDGTVIYMRSKARSQALPESGEPTFTDLEPRRMSTSEKVLAVQNLMFANAMKRLQDQQQGVLAAQAALDEKLSAALVEPIAPVSGGGDGGA